MMNRPKILVVDDDPSVLRCYERLLGRWGYLPVTIADGRQLEEHFDQHRDAGLLILDYRMPAIDGLTLLDRLRNRGLRCPVLLVSAFATDEVRREAARLGVHGVLEKPIGTKHLLTCIRESLNGAPPNPA